MKRILAALVLSSLFTLGSCGGGGGGSSEGGGACSALGLRVFNGETCSQESRSPVVALFPVISDGSQLEIAGICSGTLVTVDDILTSAHCFSDPIRDFGSSIVGFVALVGGSNGQALPIVNAQIHPLYNGQVGSRFDIGMATLSEVPSPAIGPVPLLISQLTESGQRMSTFGYGTNNQGEVGVLKSAELQIDAIQGGNLIATLENSGASICAGDSGGPAIQNINGIASLVGVNSFGVANSEICSSTGSQFSGFVDIQNDQILSFIAGFAPDVPTN